MLEVGKCYIAKGMWTLWPTKESAIHYSRSVSKQAKLLNPSSNFMVVSAEKGPSILHADYYYQIVGESIGWLFCEDGCEDNFEEI